MKSLWRSYLLAAIVLCFPPPAIGGDTRLGRCKLGHGAKMTAAGVLLLPAGLLVAPFYPATAATGFADSFAEAFQEDTCTRPFGSMMP
jgi:hypothetical protein